MATIVNLVLLFKNTTKNERKLLFFFLLEIELIDRGRQETDSLLPGFIGSFLLAITLAMVHPRLMTSLNIFSHKKLFEAFPGNVRTLDISSYSQYWQGSGDCILD